MSEYPSENLHLNFSEHQILRAVRELKFGVVEVVIHDSRVTEIKQTKRLRVESKSSPVVNGRSDS